VEQTFDGASSVPSGGLGRALAISACTDCVVVGAADKSIAPTIGEFSCGGIAWLSHIRCVDLWVLGPSPLKM
jgi:hypothetical protein